ncbi:hypothetical protein [Paraburkholderia unamae]|uniref:Uncharacterized protein n=1 Tax=Paraburkholderia unamae TaxID=219649 RepID=A0ABX5KHY6_9BURK|nr:hypothetical protein [Paraburkholderia unamae]PVX77021.1 hypothetical protein C7402_11580 [Paraburkholderia unamae]CAG9260448.1 hypothetical protein PUN4_340256 [Paraburkholderia unamae]
MPSRYFAVAALAGSRRSISSSVGLRGFFTGMGSGFDALSASEAECGGFAIGVEVCARAPPAMTAAMAAMTAAAQWQYRIASARGAGS